jgi:mannose-1-phosphate guanylyltransferase
LAANADDPLLLVLPADHVIRDVPAFQNAVTIAVAAARAGHLVTFGVVPDAPETGYGYIRRGVAQSGGLSHRPVCRETAAGAGTAISAER